MPEEDTTAYEMLWGPVSVEDTPLFEPAVRKFRFLLKLNDGLIGFYESGLVVSCHGCEPDENGNYEFMFDRQPHTSYVIDDNRVVMGNTFAFDMFHNGYIHEDWIIFNSRPVEFRQSITQFKYYRGVEQEDMCEINESCFIILSTSALEEEEDDEGSGDLAYYLSNKMSQMEEIGIPTRVCKNKYLLLSMEENQKIIVDTTVLQNGEMIPFAFLYRKGHVPIIVDIVDHDMEVYKSYLGL